MVTAWYGYEPTPAGVAILDRPAPLPNYRISALCESFFENLDTVQRICSVEHLTLAPTEKPSASPLSPLTAFPLLRCLLRSKLLSYAANEPGLVELGS